MSQVQDIRLQSLADTSANWEANNPILLKNEVGYDLDTGAYKIGDGVSAWNDLAYANVSGVGLIKDLTGETILEPGMEEAIVAEEGALIIGDTRERTFQTDEEGNLTDYPMSGNLATAPYSIAMGRITEAKGYYSTASGSRTKAYGHYSFAAGNGTQALASNSIAMGNGSIANNSEAIAIGQAPKALGNQSVAIGSYPEAIGNQAVALGCTTKAYGQYSTAFGYKSETGEVETTKGKWAIAGGNVSIAKGEGAIALGGHTVAEGAYSVAMNTNTQTNAANQFAIGQFNAPDETQIFMVGNGGSATSRKNAFSVGFNGDIQAEGDIYSKGSKVALSQEVAALSTSIPVRRNGSGVIIGDLNNVTVDENGKITAGNRVSSGLGIAIGSLNDSGTYSTSIGYKNKAENYGIAVGVENTATGNGAVALGRSNTASGGQSAALGYLTQAKGIQSLALGNRCVTNENAQYSIAAGLQCQVYGARSFSMGGSVIVKGTESFGFGSNILINETASQQIAVGKFNAADDGKIFIVGNGTNNNNRSNAFSVDWAGNANCAGAITSRATTDDDDDLVLVTKGYVKELINNMINASNEATE